MFASPNDTCAVANQLLRKFVMAETHLGNCGNCNCKFTIGSVKLMKWNSLRIKRNLMMLRINDGITIEDWELIEHFSRSSGPGGQHVNKVSTAVELRFDAINSPGLNDEIRIRLKNVAGRRWTADGIIVIHVDDTRSQKRNRDIAKNRLVNLVRKAAMPPKKRKPTQIPSAERKKRFEEKKMRGNVKALRGKVDQIE